ncbi:uncharacterized protein C8Q71DRAFT_195466 [Rhodofomes roseus]|uniref:Uncharacterized protein n=1 Tax=Rhodofomes roseus TaxID=34475 RepID=A0ABQ8K8U0_9APHY|nr:uncharacterized protein C8Q71DRAFT_195466 [Rhodofomes roseus]KAH9833250.1 hypothetical protein C8Q71DRAFT_195466 [Rhodofomes roseus]
MPDAIWQPWRHRKPHMHYVERRQIIMIGSERMRGPSPRYNASLRNRPNIHGCRKCDTIDSPFPESPSTNPASAHKSYIGIQPSSLSKQRGLRLNRRAEAWETQRKLSAQYAWHASRGGGDPVRRDGTGGPPGVAKGSCHVKCSRCVRHHGWRLSLPARPPSLSCLVPLFRVRSSSMRAAEVRRRAGARARSALSDAIREVRHTRFGGSHALVGVQFGNMAKDNARWGWRL